jgi:endo-1,3-1,4-beta-glycanase ExoK
MKKHHFLGLAVVLLAIFCVGASDAAAAGNTGEFTDNLSSFDTTRWQKSNWANGLPFGCKFNPANITYSGGKMNLKITETPTGTYDCAEYQSLGVYGYGTYSARLKAASDSGVITAFFVYTGNWGQVNHQEIDFEIFGEDPHIAQLSYYAYGIGHGTEINLGFDASSDYHTYTFVWSPEQITWYVDGIQKQVSVTAPGPLPPAKIMVNLWNGDNSPGMADWAGEFTYLEIPIPASVDWISFTK